MHIKITGIFTFIFLASVTVILCSCLQRYNNYGVVGTPVTSADNKILVAVVTENAATTHSENPSYRKTTYKVTYWLKQYETATGKFLKKKKLFDADETNNRSVSCYGSYGNTIWLYANSIRAYDITTLDETANEEKLAAGNGVKKNIFPYDARLITAAVQNGYINFVSNNGDEYHLLLSEQKIIPGKLSSNTAAENAAAFFYKDDYGVRCDTLSNHFFAFAKDSMAAAQCRPGYSTLHETAYRMKLFKADFTIKKLGSNNSFNYQNIMKQGSASYLNPCFVKDNYTNTVIHLQQPYGYLIIHQDVLGEKSKAIITRIDTANKQVWETFTNISTKIGSCTVKGNYFIITTNKAYMLSPFIGKDALCIINTANGNLTELLLKE